MCFLRLFLAENIANSTFLRIFDENNETSIIDRRIITMAKRRILKQSITNICSILFAEGVASSLENKHPDNAEALLKSIIKMESDFVSRVSHVEPGMKPKLYFKDLVDKFNAQVIEVVDQINNE